MRPLQACPQQDIVQPAGLRHRDCHVFHGLPVLLPGHPQGLETFAAAAGNLDVHTHLAWIDRELDSAREFENTGQDTTHFFVSPYPQLDCGPAPPGVQPAPSPVPLASWKLTSAAPPLCDLILGEEAEKFHAEEGRLLPFVSPPAMFKGERPASVILHGVEIEVSNLLSQYIPASIFNGEAIPSG